MLARTQNHLVFHLNWPELTVRALFIIYRSLLLGCISNLREIGQLCLDLLHFKDIIIQINVLSQQSRECSFNYCIPISIFKAIGQLLMEVLHFKDWRTLSCGCNCSCSSARRLSKFNSKELFFTRQGREFKAIQAIQWGSSQWQIQDLMDEGAWILLNKG